MDLLQEIHEELSFKHTGIKEEPCSAPIQDTHANHIQQETSPIKTDVQLLKESMNTHHHQYATSLHTNPVTFQKQLSKMKKDIKLLQQTKRPNVRPIPPGTYRSFRTIDGFVICQRCNQVGHFASACPANLPRAPTSYQNYRRNYKPPPPHNIHGHRTILINPPINILTVLPIDQTTVDTILWDIFTHKILSVPIPHKDHYLHMSIEATTSTKLKSPTSQVNNTIIVTRYKTSYTSLPPLLNPPPHLSLRIICLTHTSPMHTLNTYLPHSYISVHSNRPCPIISTEPATIPARTNTIMTTPCARPCSKNFLFKPSQQHFVDQPVQ